MPLEIKTYTVPHFKVLNIVKTELAVKGIVVFLHKNLFER